MQDTRPERIIDVLDETTANQIAAGEVIERPASVVKELVENALDAKADEIRIELHDGGKKLIRVTDNGIGMSREDAVLSIRRHATSKLHTADDLFNIRTLGFRGEALPSIASVSRTEIVTRRDGDDCGTQVVVTGGEIVETNDAGAPVGTSVSVHELFYNLPARQKFLKTAQTELSHASELVSRFAISHGEVDITLAHNGKTIFRSSGSNRPTEAVLTVFGRDAAEAVVPINGRAGAYRITGLVSKPSYSKANRSAQLFFVNRRCVRNRNLIHALDEAYRGILPQGRFPLLIAFVEVDPELLDVNVHPTKMEVKFSKEWEVHNLLAISIKDALSSSAVSPDGSDLIPVAATTIQRPEFTPSYAPPPRHPAASNLDLETFRQVLQTRLDRPPIGISAPLQDPASAPAPSDSPGPVTADPNDLLSGVAVIGQARNMYIVAQGPAGVLLIDQHVAHERIIHDQLSSMQGRMSMQRLMIPLTMMFSHRESLVLENKLDEIRSLGFEIEPFGKDTFVVRTIPALIAEKNYEQILRDTVEELAELTATRRLLVQRDSIITTTACKMAVKAGDRLAYEEMIRLIEDLRRTSNPYLCPHGRPIVVCFSNNDLDKLFGRM